MPDSEHAAWLTDRLARLRAGDQAARRDLLEFAIGRLERLADKMLHGQFGSLARWVETSDVFQNSAVRLWRALGRLVPDSPLHFHRLAAMQVRLELLDLARHFFGPDGCAANYDSWEIVPGDPAAGPPTPDRAAPAGDPGRELEWAELNELVRALPENEAAVTDLVFYQGLTQEEAADLLGVDVRTVQRRWQRARRKLGEYLSEAE